MKHFITSLLLLTTVFVWAQSNLEDVIYLKNGNVYRGVLVEQVPGQYYNMQTVGGNIFHILVADVSKITREAVFNNGSVRNDRGNGRDNGAAIALRDAKRARKDSLKKAWTPRVKGYFFQSQLLIENLQGGIRIVNGYRFGRFGQVGLGIGVDLSGPTVGSRMRGNGNNATGTFMPIYAYYAGDIMKKRITPFYALELGYTFGRLQTSTYMYEVDCIDCGGYNNEVSSMAHGMMGGAGIGVRFNSLKRINFSLLLNVNFKALNYKSTYYYYNQNGLLYQEDQTNSVMLVYPGLRFGIGF